MMKAAKRPIALLVDDELELVDELGETFEDLGFEVRTATDYRDAVIHIKAQAPDLVCMNLSLSRGSGYDVCEFVRSFPARPGPVILVMSDRCSPEDFAFAQEAGANAVLRRPVSPDLVRDTVMSLLKERGHRAPVKRPVGSLLQPAKLRSARVGVSG